MYWITRLVKVHASALEDEFHVENEAIMVRSRRPVKANARRVVVYHHGRGRVWDKYLLVKTASNVQIIRSRARPYCLIQYQLKGKLHAHTVPDNWQASLGGRGAHGRLGFLSGTGAKVAIK